MSSNRHVILITIDSLRADHLCSLGYVKKLTPSLDKIAEKGVLFTQAISYGSTTFASIPPMLTSSPIIPYYHEFLGTKKGIMNLDEGLRSYKELVTRLFELKVTIAAALMGHGYETAAFHSNPYLSRYYGYGKDFSYLDDSFGAHDFRKKIGEKVKIALMSRRIDNLAKRLYFLIFPNKIPYERAEQINKKAISWLRVKKPEKFFLWLHYMDTHIPYKPPKYFRPKMSGSKMSYLNRKILNEEDISEGELSQIIELYDGSIKYVDYSIKCLLNELNDMKILEDTIVVITSDHGEEFKDHGDFLHIETKLYDELIHVPLIIYNAEYTNITIDEPVSHLDIAPTITDLLNLPMPETFQGRSLIPIIEGEKSSGVISQGIGCHGLDDNLKIIVAYRTKRWKYILDKMRDREELYDMKEDPKETNNLNNVKKDIAEDLKFRILEHISRQQELVAMDVEKEKIRRKIKKLREVEKSIQAV